MSTFDTPAPIAVGLDVPAGSVRVIATDRTDTVVEVLPSHPGSKADTAAAEQTHVEFADRTLTVRVPRQSGLFNRTGSVRVRVELPTGSNLGAHLASADVQTEGSLGECRVKSASGDVRLGAVGTLRVDSASGDLSTGPIGGDATVIVQSGDVRIGGVAGSAEVRTTSGDVQVGAVGGDLRVSSASGDIAVERVGGDLGAKVASGDVRVGEVVRGRVRIEAASGDLTVGVREGTAAWLDIQSLSGTVRNTLAGTDGPGDAAERVELHVRTISGDITIRRSQLAPA